MVWQRKRARCQLADREKERRAKVCRDRSRKEIPAAIRCRKARHQLVDWPPGGGTRQRNGAVLSDSQGDVVFGVCRAPPQRGNRTVRFHAGKDATCSTNVVWWRPSRETRHLHHSAIQDPIVASAK